MLHRTHILLRSYATPSPKTRQYMSLLLGYYLGIISGLRGVGLGMSSRDNPDVEEL